MVKAFQHNVTEKIRVWFAGHGLSEKMRVTVIKLFSCSTQLSMKFSMFISMKIFSFFSNSDQPKVLFFLLINVKMPTIVGILIFMSRKNFMQAKSN